MAKDLSVDKFKLGKNKERRQRWIYLFFVLWLACLLFLLIKKYFRVGSYKKVQKAVKEFLDQEQYYFLSSSFISTELFDGITPSGRQDYLNLTKDELLEWLPIACYRGDAAVGLYLIIKKRKKIIIRYRYYHPVYKN